MAKAVTVNGEERPAQLKRQEPSAVQNLSGNVAGFWDKITQLSERRARRDAQGRHPFAERSRATTSVVLVAVFMFGFFFMVTDFVFNRAISQILHKLGGVQ